MTPTTIVLLTLLVVVVMAGIVAAAIDLSKIFSHALDRHRARRAARRGWDWPAFEREVARYMGGRGGRRPTPR